jgi:hypothetical protein
MYTGPHLAKDNLIFGYDTGYGIADNSTSTRFYPGKPSTNLLGTTGDMLPTNPQTPYDLTTSSSTSNVNGTTWDLSLYNSTSLATNNGVAWHPNIEGPGFKGAWRLKKRPGSNWETQFSNGLGAVSNTTAIVLSVWCKTTVSGVARINANTTRNGSSNWGNSSAYHSGSGKWERLSYVIPAGSGVTSINSLRCQVGGTTLTTDVYWRRFQVEYGTTPTPFITGTRSSTQSLIDLKRTADIDLSNVSFDSTGQPEFDGTNDFIQIPDPNISSSNGFSIEMIIKPTNASSSPMVITPNSGGIDHFVRFNSNGRLYMRMIVAPDSSVQDFTTTTSLSSTGYHYVVFTFKQSEGGKAYYNGNQESAASANFTALDWSNVWRIGQRGNNTYFFDGELPILKVYNQILSANEIKQNFNAYKNRFGI